MTLRPGIRLGSHEIVASLAVLACLLAGSVARAEPVRVPGTRVTLDRPPGFAPAERYPGFERADMGSSIMVTELPGPAATMQKGMTAEVLASRGMTFIRSQSTKIGGSHALLLHVSQSVAGVEFLKWMLIAGDAKRTVMVVGTFPKDAQELSLPIKRAVLSATWGREPPAASYEGLAFRVDATPVLKLAGRVGNTLVFSESGTMEPAGADQGILVIGSSLSETAIGGIEEFAKRRAAQTSQVGALRNVAGNALAVDSLPGYELVAEADDVKTGLAVRMYQLVLLDGGTYYLAQGFVGAKRPVEFLDEFRQITGTFRRQRH